MHRSVALVKIPRVTLAQATQLGLRDDTADLMARNLIHKTRSSALVKLSYSKYSGNAVSILCATFRISETQILNTTEQR